MAGPRGLRQHAGLFAFGITGTPYPFPTDKELLAEADKLRIEIAAQSGDEVQRVVQNAYASTPAVIDRLCKIVEP